jgi:antitoxin component of MazEF toxin-antitoxin module
LSPDVNYQHQKIRRRYSLEELLEGVTPEYFNGEMDWGEPVGEEVW